MAEERPPPERGSAETAAAVEDPGEQSGPQLLRLARRNRAAAIEKLRALSLDRQARACLELRPALRSNFLGLLDQPESVVPLLPETELAITIRAGGMSEAAWLLEIATPAQRRACFDLDCWYGLPGSEGKSIDLTRAYEWIEALIEATHPEVPYSGAVTVDEFLDEPGLTRISATIVVPRDSHKGIVIGKGGSMLKAVGSAARAEIEALLQRKVFLKLWVKVVEDWTDNPRRIRDLTGGGEP